MGYEPERGEEILPDPAALVMSPARPQAQFRLANTVLIPHPLRTEIKPRPMAAE